jgi:hypothetical protein
MPIGVVSNASGWWNENFPYNKKGDYLFTGCSHEGGKGYLLSSVFEIGVGLNGGILFSIVFTFLSNFLI